MKETDSRGSVAAGESIGTDYTPEEVVEAIGLDEAEIEWRKEFLGFEEADAERLAGLRGVVEAKEDELVDAFLAPIYGTEETAAITDRSPRDNDALRAIVAGYYRTLTGGQYDQEYFKHRTRIGQLHNRLDMPLHYFTGMFGNVINIVAGELMDGLAETARAELDPEDAEAMVAEIEETTATLAAGVRMLNLDMQVVNDTYLHSFTTELFAEIEQSQEMRETVGESLSENRASIERVRDNLAELDDIAEGFDSDTGQVAREVSDMSATIEEIAASSDEATETSREAVELAETGTDRAEESVAAIADIDRAREDLADQIDDLVAAVDEVNEVVDVIDDIADQTNMLALNASIEAARAGEAGSGFAVVADEVKSLAEQTREEAGRIERLLGGVTADIDEAAETLATVERRIDAGRTNIEETDAALEDIRERVAAATGSMSEVAAATDDQAASTTEVASMVDDIAARADDIAAEVSAVSAEIDRQAQEMAAIEAAVEELTGAAAEEFGTVTDPGEWDGPTHRTDRSLSQPKRAADGGTVGADGAGAASKAPAGEDGAPEGVPPALYDALPEGMPDEVVATMDTETLRKVATGELEGPF